MPLIEDPDRFNRLYGRRAGARGAPSRDRTDLGALVAETSMQVLAREPALVADVAAGRAERVLLENLVRQVAGQAGFRAGLTGEAVVEGVLDFMFGYGPLQDLIEDDRISDIDGTRFDRFTIRRDGRRTPVDIGFPDPRTFDAFCRLLVIRNGGILNDNDSHCRVTDPVRRLRMNVAVPPRNLSGPSLCIRKHRLHPPDLAELQATGMFPPALLATLRAFASSRSSVLISGRGGSGKTTLLRALLHGTDSMERILVVESDPELFPDHAGCVIQRVRKPHEGGRPVTLRDLVADGLTMSLDTYCVGELVGDEALEFIRASFTGHRCLGTIHAESAAAIPDRLVALACPAGADGRERLLRRMLGSGLDLLVHLDGYRIVEILEMVRHDEAADRFRTRRLYPMGKEERGS